MPKLAIRNISKTDSDQEPTRREAAINGDTPKLRVLSIPGKNCKENRYFVLFCGGLEAAGVQLVNVRNQSAMKLAFDVIHIHFPDHYVTERTLLKAILHASSLLILLISCKLLGKKIVWTVHDVVPFKIRHRFLLAPFMAIVRGLTSAYVFMNDSTESQFMNLYPGQRKKRACRILLGAFDVEILRDEQKAKMRRDLGLKENGLVLGFLGDIKPYKNIEALSKVPESTVNGEPITLLIAGKADPTEYRDQVNALLDQIGRHRVVRLDERLTDRRLAELTQLTDIVFLPYKKGSNSSAAMLALSCRTRILTSDLPMFADLQRLTGNEWVYIFQDNRELGGLEADVVRALSSRIEPKDREKLQEFLSDSDFSVSSEKLLRFYASIR